MLPLLGYASSLAWCCAMLWTQAERARSASGSTVVQLYYWLHICPRVTCCNVSVCNKQSKALDFCQIVCYAIGIRIREGLPTKSNRTFIQFQIMSNLIPFTPSNCDMPVAMVSPNLPSWIKDVLNDSWDKTSSGLGTHTYVEDMIQDVTDPEVLQEYWDEYSV